MKIKINRLYLHHLESLVSIFYTEFHSSDLQVCHSLSVLIIAVVGVREYYLGKEQWLNVIIVQTESTRIQYFYFVLYTNLDHM